MSTDRGTIGYGAGPGSWASGAISYGANTGKANATVAEAASHPTYPYIHKPNGGVRTFNFKDVNGGSNVASALVYLREHYSQQQIGPIRSTDASGNIAFRNLDTTAYYTVIAIHPSSASFNAAVADWIVANPG